MVRDLTALPRRLRRESTPAERRLWGHLRDRRLGVRFRRQHPIGPYVADFACVEARLVVEVDGGVHAARDEHDLIRTRALQTAGWRVLRATNDAVFADLASVLERIEAAIMKARSPHPGANAPVPRPLRG